MRPRPSADVLNDERKGLWQIESWVMLLPRALDRVCDGLSPARRPCRQAPPSVRRVPFLRCDPGEPLTSAVIACILSYHLRLDRPCGVRSRSPDASRGVRLMPHGLAPASLPARLCPKARSRPLYVPSRPSSGPRLRLRKTVWQRDCPRRVLHRAVEDGKGPDSRATLIIP